MAAVLVEHLDDVLGVFVPVVSVGDDNDSKKSLVPSILCII